MSQLTEILNQCADQSPQFTLKILVIYGNQTQRLQGYHTPGQPWVIFEHADMIEFRYKEMTDAMSAAGVDMTGRPVSQPGLAQHWPVGVMPGRQNVRLMKAASADSIERKRINRLYEEEQTARDLRDGVAESDVFSHLPQELQAAITGAN